MLTWQKRASENPWRKNWPTEQQDESRQEYATVRIHQMQLAALGLKHEALPLDFNELVRAFRMFGEDYDCGYRLRDHTAGAA